MVRYNPILEVGQNTTATYGITLYDVNERPYEGLDLTNAAQVLLTMEHKAWGETVVSEGVCDIPEETEEEGYVEYTFSAQETRYYGTHFIQFEIEYENGEVGRVPPEGFDWTLFIGRRLPKDSPLRASNAIIDSLTVGGGGPYTSLEGPGLYRDEGELAVSISAEGVDGLTNPLIEHMDASGFDILNPRDFGKDDARARSVFTQGLIADSATVASELGIPTYSDDTTAPDSTLFLDDIDGVLKYKDASGTVHSGGGGDVSNPLETDLDANQHAITNARSVGANLVTHQNTIDEDHTLAAGEGTVIAGELSGTGSISGEGSLAVIDEGFHSAVKSPMEADVDAAGNSITGLGSLGTEQLNTNRVWDTSGRYHGELTGSNDAQVVIDAIADRTGNEGIIIPDPGFPLDWEQQVDIPYGEHGFTLATLGLPVLTIPSGFAGSSAIRKPATNGAFRGYRGYRIGGFSFDDSNHQLDWAINLSNVKESVIEPSIFDDCPAIRIHSNDGYANQNKIYGPLIKSDEGRGPGILLDHDPDTDITADQNWIIAPCFSDGGNGTETAFIDRGKHNNWLFTRVEFARVCHSQDPPDGVTGKNYYISSGGWDRSYEFEYTVIERGDTRGVIDRVYGNPDYDKLQLSSPSTVVRHVGDPKAEGSNRSANASNLLHDLSDITPVQSLESVGLQDTSDANSSVSYNFPYFTRPRLHFDTAADETASMDLGSGALDDAGIPKSTLSFFPRGSTGPTGVVARWGFYADDSNRAELIYDPDDVLGGHGTATWFLEVVNGGTVDGSIDLGATPDDRQFLTLNHREDEWSNRHWSATTDQGEWADIQTTRLGTGTWRWLIRSVDGASHGWAIDTSLGATLWRR